HRDVRWTGTTAGRRLKEPTMNSELSAIHRGMAVYGRDGAYLGKVAAIRLRGRAVTHQIRAATQAATIAQPAAEASPEPLPAGRRRRGRGGCGRRHAEG